MIEIQVDTRAIDQALRRLESHVEDTSPAMRAIGEHIASQIDLSFRDAKDPYGNPWKELSAVTVAKRRRESSKPLNDTGHLKASITSNPGHNEVTIGTNEKYGRTHQFGATQGQYGRSRRNGPIPWGNIPARPFMPTESGGMPLDWEQDILDIIRDYIIE